MRTVYWDGEHNAVCMIDQRLLPGEFKVVSYSDYHQVADAIRDMVVRGAPAIGATAAFGLALAAHASTTQDARELSNELAHAGEILQAARPTAVNLTWALKRVLAVVAAVQDRRMSCERQCWQKRSASPMRTWRSTSAWHGTAPT